MFVDTSLQFSSWSAGQALTALTAGQTGYSSNAIDIYAGAVANTGSLTSATYQGAAAPVVFNNVSGSVLSADLGIGDGVVPPTVQVNVFTTFTAASGSPPLTVNLYGAIDNGSYAAGTATLLYTSAAIATSNLVNNYSASNPSGSGTVLQFPIPPRVPGEAKPRFYYLTYTLGGSGTWSAGAVAAGIVLNPPSSLTGSNMAINY